jgi:U4/U6 small nuclear ribonucleoprotein PRP31
MAETTLADSLLDDLDDLSDGDEPQVQEPEEEEPTDEPGDGHRAKQENYDSGDVQMKDDNDQEEDKKPPATVSSNNNSSVIKKRLLDSPSLQHHLTAIRKSQLLTPSSSKEQRQAEHHLIVQSNKHLANLADELARAHGVVCTCYKPKFSELEELLPNPVQYKNAVRVIWNELDIARVSEELHAKSNLSSNQIITISVAGSTTSGRQLTKSELQALEQAVQYVEDILQVQEELTRFVESRMESLAPSVCVLVGPSTAAVLLGLAGGLAELSKIPSCNLQVLGQVKATSSSRAGLSSTATKPHQGVLAECDLVTRAPKALQKRALKTVAAKLALAARCDFVNVDAGRPRSAASGRKFREEIETKINQWLEPDIAPVLKALPK